MASKIYTAREMRNRANEFYEYLNNEDHFAVKEIDNDARMLADMLRQAAEALESEEKRKASTTTDYSFVDESGFRVSYLYDSVETAKRRAIELGYNAKYFIRREVGAWEEVRDGE